MKISRLRIGERLTDDQGHVYVYLGRSVYFTGSYVVGYISAAFKTTAIVDDNDLQRLQVDPAGPLLTDYLAVLQDSLSRSGRFAAMR